MVEVTVHPGIGDLSWIYSKLVNCGRPLKLRIAEDRKTSRAAPYAALLPAVVHAEYGDLSDYIPLAKAWNAYWGEFLEAEDAGKDLMVSANNWLEAGNRLEGFMPDLPTEFHYEITTEPADAERAETLLPVGRTFGIYTSSLGGAVNWRGWQVGEWLEFGRRVHAEWPDLEFVFIGAKWDMDLTTATAGAYAAAGLPVRNICGRTRMGAAIEILKRLDYFISYASGMGILANVLWRPSAMMYPRHLHKLMQAWPCPVTLATGLHRGMLWQRPVDVVDQISPELEAIFA